MESSLTFLSGYIVSLCTCTVVNYEVISEKVKELTDMVKLISLKELTAEDRNTILKINQCTTLLGEVLADRINAQNTTTGSDSLEKAIHVSEAEIMTSPEENKAGLIKPSGKYKVNKPSKRLSKVNLGFLETWFRDNADHPYLNTQTLNSLIKATGLSKSQVQNW
ncbi:HMLALPHA2 [Candida jiufengensis]|uniref:HMLALPHA2 n=1 Tax=Candida jiufengensis TaxID=497108 RepID=UPI00222413E8|nr:HMLALPHA2 [Candida jiufengensis]KAI5956542.1 HMLALPHA2 [Candida jiufengensis]